MTLPISPVPIVETDIIKSVKKNNNKKISSLDMINNIDLRLIFELSGYVSANDKNEEVISAAKKYDIFTQKRLVKGTETLQSETISESIPNDLVELSFAPN